MFPWGQFMLNDKEIKIYETIKSFIKDNGYSPSIRDLCKILNIKSTKTVYNYLVKLKGKKIIDFPKSQKRSLSITNTVNYSLLIINTKNMMTFDIENNHLLFQIKNNFFNEYFIKKNDYLVINVKKRIKNNDLGLFLINDEYRIMKYTYYDGYYILEDNKKEVLYQINLLGVVEKIIRDKI